MGRNSDIGAASEDSVAEVIPLASTAAQLEKLADGAAENVTSKRARVF